MARRHGLMAAILALALGGCVVSEKPLFDASRAVMPALAGRYEQQEMRDGKWVTVRAGTLRLNGRSYEWLPDKDKAAPRFSVFEAGSDYFTLYALVQDDAGKPRHYYALVQPTPVGYLFYQPLCRDFRELKLRVGLRPAKVVEGDCYFEDDAALSAALVAYAKALPPEFRYVRVGELPPAPPPARGAARPAPPAPFVAPSLGARRLAPPTSTDEHP
jgi:hypothetical protein